MSCSLLQGLCKCLAGNVLRERTGTRQRRSAQERGAVGRAALSPEQQRGVGSWPGWEGKGREWLSTWALCRRLQFEPVNRPLAKLLDCYGQCKRRAAGSSATLRCSWWLWEPEAYGALAAVRMTAVSHHLIPIIRGGLCGTGAVRWHNPRERSEESKGKPFICSKPKKVTSWTWAGA